MIKSTRRRLFAPVLGAVGLLAVVTATAFAGANALHVSVPAYVTAKTSYTITVSATTSRREHLYLFVDSKRCGRSPAVEFSRTGKHGSSYGYYWRTVRGSVSKSAGFNTSVGLTDHACAYLAGFRAKKNSKYGIVARAFRTFRVHKLKR
jgi:hypothetical protein